MHSKAEVKNVVIIQFHISCLLHCVSLCKVQSYVRVSSSIRISNGVLLVAFDVKVARLDFLGGIPPTFEH